MLLLEIPERDNREIRAAGGNGAPHHLHRQGWRLLPSFRLILEVNRVPTALAGRDRMRMQFLRRGSHDDIRQDSF